MPLPAILAPIIASLGSEAGKKALKWGLIGLSVIVFIGSIGLTTYYRSKYKEEEAAKIQVEGFYKKLQDEVTILQTHYEKERLERLRQQREKNEAERQLNQQKNSNDLLVKDIDKSVEQFQCQLDHYGDNLGDCHNGQFIKRTS